MSRDSKRIMIIGGLAAGPSAAAKAKRVNPNAEVTILEATDTISYAICEAPYAIGGLIEDERRLNIFTPEKFQEEKGITVKTQHHVEKIIPPDHKLVVRDFGTHKLIDFEYDKLIIATGSVSRKLMVEGEDGRNVFHLKSAEDTRNIITYLKTNLPKHVVIIGAGYVGLEMAEVLRSNKLEVTLIDKLSHPLEGFEQETRERILRELIDRDINFIPLAIVEALQQDKTGKVKHVITNRGSYECDMVILTLDVEANVGLAKDARIKIGITGAIATDEKQQTNLEDIYAAGDCSEVKNIITGKPMYIPLATVAYKTSRVAGENAAGGRVVFRGVIRSAAIKIFNLEVAQVGLSYEEAKAYGFQVLTEMVTSSTKVSMMPDCEEITIKLVIDVRSQKLLGANLFGESGTALWANTLAVAIQHHMTLDDISRFDLIYTPSFSPLPNPILITVNQAKKKFKK